MSNVMLTPADWTDDQFNNPPRWWDGTKYVFLDANSGGYDHAGTVMTAEDASFMSTVQDGDRVAFTFNNLAPPVYNAGHSDGRFQVVIDGVVIADYSLDVVGSQTFESDPLSAGADVELRLTEGSGPSYYNLYAGYDFELVPTPDAPAKFWTDLVACEEI